LIIKRVPTGYDGLMPHEKFQLIEHSGITMLNENEAERFYENVKKFDPKKSGIVVLVEWNVEKAAKAGFLAPGKYFQIF
jgi:hypothetical protein